YQTVRGCSQRTTRHTEAFRQLTFAREPAAVRRRLHERHQGVIGLMHGRWFARHAQRTHTNCAPSDSRATSTVTASRNKDNWSDHSATVFREPHSEAVRGANR